MLWLVLNCIVAWILRVHKWTCHHSRCCAYPMILYMSIFFSIEWGEVCYLLYVRMALVTLLRQIKPIQQGSKLRFAQSFDSGPLLPFIPLIPIQIWIVCTFILSHVCCQSLVLLFLLIHSRSCWQYLCLYWICSLQLSITTITTTTANITITSCLPLLHKHRCHQSRPIRYRRPALSTVRITPFFGLDDLASDDHVYTSIESLPPGVVELLDDDANLWEM